MRSLGLFQAAVKRVSTRDRIAVGLLAVILLGTAAMHLWFVSFAPETRRYGDEKLYVKMGCAYAKSNVEGLTPGRLPFCHRPQFYSCAISSFVGAGESSEGAFIRRVRVFQVVLFVLILGCLYVQGRALGLGEFIALAPCVLLCLFPWFGFYVHALWPEMVHAAFASASFALLFLHLRTNQVRYLPLAALFFGYALFTKGTLHQFLVPLIPFLGGNAVLAARGLPVGRRLWAGLKPVVAFAIPLMLVVGPQLHHNCQHGHGLRLASNKWRNIEWSVRRPLVQGAQEGWTWGDAQRRYFGASDTLVGQECACEKRLMAYLRSVPPKALLGQQFQKYALLFTGLPSMLESAGVRDRWGPEASGVLRYLVTYSRGLWYLMLVLAAIGVSLLGWRNPGWALLSLFALYYLTALFVVSFNVRFAMQFVPCLCLLSVGGLFCLLRRMPETGWPKIGAEPGPRAWVRMRQVSWRFQRTWATWSESQKRLGVFAGIGLVLALAGLICNYVLYP